jgi:hypothetical protein
LGNRDIVAQQELERAAPRVAPFHLACACLLAWLLPGAGHWYLGRRRRAVLFFLLIRLSFGLGAFFDGRFSVVDQRQPLLCALQVVACLGSGPMEILARTAVYGAPSIACLRRMTSAPWRSLCRDRGRQDAGVETRL